MTQPVQAYQLVITSVGNSSNGVAVYSGTITGGGAGAFVGMYAQIDGFPDVANGSNNGVYAVVASGSGSITLANGNAVSASANATATVFTSLVATATETVAGAQVSQLTVAPQSVNPALPSGNTGAAPPFSSPTSTGSLVVPGTPAGSSLTPRNFDGGYNYVHTITSTQESINGANGIVLSQQGTTAVANVTAVSLAGYPVGALQFYQWQGSYNSVK